MPNAPFLVYVVEDDEYYNKLLVHSLSLNPDFEIKSFFTGKDLLKNISDSPAVVTIDYRLPDMDGAELLKEIKKFDPSIEVVVISEQADIETALNLLRQGAYDYIVKSNDTKDKILNTVSNIKKNFGLQRRIVSLQKEVENKYAFEKTIIGNSPAIENIYHLISKALTTNISVIITGETGTGKELVAKAIHYNSIRKEKPFVAVNMAAIPSELVESELFGHEKGAFTGALNTRKGKFEEANGGTLFLDEIGEMDLNSQAKLLRVLQEKEIIRVGSNLPIKADCKIIVATNRNLQEDIKEGKFRTDLYYRLLGITILLPPLRERDKDALLLAHHFVVSFCKENKLEVKHISEGARQKILSYNWPGNIRELKSVIELAVVMSSGNEILTEDITLGNGTNQLPEIISEDLTMREYNIKIVKLYMDKYNNNKKMVAEKLDIGETTIYRLLKEDELEGKSTR